MPVGALHHQPDGHPVALGQQAALDPAFGAIRSDWAGSSPPQAGPWSSRRPCSARPSQCRAARQTVPHPPARGSRRPPLRPTPETDRARWIWHITRSDSRAPIGSRCEARKKWHRHSGDPGPVGRPPPKRWVVHRTGSSGARTAHSASSEMRNPWSCGCWGHVRVFVLVLVMYSCFQVYQVIRIGSGYTTTGNHTEPPWYGPVCQVVWEGGAARLPPHPDSKTPWMATLHPTVESQRDRGCWVKQCSPHAPGNSRAST